MSKKKKPDKARQAWKRRTAMKERKAEVALPDWRALEGKMHEMIRGPAELNNPLRRAQDLIYQAFDYDDPEMRCQLAQKALALCADCADAYVLLAEHANSRREALDLYAKGMEAGERSLGAEAFQRNAGHFWGVLQTRPYMRARAGLARLLWLTGQREQAVGHLEELLRLNPNDNQGLRYLLAACYFRLDRDKELTALLDRYPGEGSAVWAYARALLSFRQQGDGAESQRLLDLARKTNPFVPDYLLELKFPPERLPSTYSPGEESEAIVFIQDFLGVWKATPGAVDWLRARGFKTGEQRAAEQGAGPSAKSKQSLRALPQRSAVWQADVRELPTWIQHAGARIHPFVILVTDPRADLVLESKLVEQPPTADILWDALYKSMKTPSAGSRQRPAKVQVRNSGLWEVLRPHLHEIGIALVLTDQLDHVDFVLEHMLDSFGFVSRPGLLDTPGVEPAQVGDLYSAAAFYFRQAPWRKVAYESALKITSEKIPGTPCYAVVMGTAGTTFGLSLYDDLRLLRRMFTGRLSDYQAGRQTVATTVVFGTEAEIPMPDLEAARLHHWEVAAPHAYPWAFRKEANQDPHPPSPAQIDLLAACLRAVPEFVSRRNQDDATREEIAIANSADETFLTMEWVVE